MSEKIKNTAIFTTTIVEPTGVPARIEISIPEAEHSTEIMAEHIVTALKFLNTLIADSDGKIMRADIKSEPTNFIARTIITAIVIAIIRLYAFAFVPTAFAKFSSKVTANILL
jgi:hypothetical protein